MRVVAQRAGLQLAANRWSRSLPSDTSVRISLQHQRPPFKMSWVFISEGATAK
jgi:hypothetical protein